MRNPSQRFVWFVGLFALFCLTIQGQEWSRFRGPNGTGQSPSQSSFKYLTKENLLWKVALPGKGHSSPVHWGERIFLTSTDASRGQFHLIAFHADNGKSLWRKDFSYQSFPKHRFNSYASSTAAVDADRVFITWGMPEMLCAAAFDHDGKMLWKRNLGPFKSMHGPGASPMLFEDLMILPNEQLGESFLIALSQKTGETRWKTPRQNAKTAYSTPCISRDAKGNPILLITSQAHGIGAIDPRTGTPLWEFPAFNKRNCSSPIVVKDLIFGTCGSGAGGNFVVAIHPPNATNPKPELAYKIRRSAPYVPCMISLDKWLFLWSDGGILSCVEPISGKLQWSERTGGRFFGSPISVADQLIAVDESGTIHVVSGTGRFAQWGKYALRESSHATPALIADHLFVRTVSHLWKFQPTQN